jgi:hypothetical protein
VPARLLTCTQCKAILPAEVVEPLQWKRCASCGSLLRVEVFPALFRDISSSAPAQPVLMESEASCFYHPNKKAVVPCENCGRFLCALCDLEVDGRHICPACLESGRNKGKLEKLENRRVLMDHLALGLAVLPLLCFWPSLLGAPATLYVVIRYWNAPAGLTNRWFRGRMILAGVLAVIEILAWVWFILYMTLRKGGWHG